MLKAANPTANAQEAATSMVSCAINYITIRINKLLYYQSTYIWIRQSQSLVHKVSWLGADHGGGGGAVELPRLEGDAVQQGRCVARVGALCVVLQPGLESFEGPRERPKF